MKNFALIGAAGFIAPRHMQAIRDTGNNLVAALDKSDSVGIIDSYFPDSAFFNEFERFDRHVEKLRRENGEHVHYVSICSPNYLHDAHIRFALRVGADAICEKPLVVNPWNMNPLGELEQKTGRRICVILQLRLHPAIIALKERIERESRDTKYDIDLTYINERSESEHVELHEALEDSVRSERLRQEVVTMGKTMADVLIERGWNKGLTEGRNEAAIETRQQTLIRQLRRRFGKLPAKVIRSINATTATEQLDEWLDRFATAQTLKELDIRIR
jgi:hypothetical protein